MRRQAASVAAAAVAGLAAVSGDQVNFLNGNLVTGEVQRMTGDGRITITSENLAGPLVMRSTALRSIEFHQAAAAGSSYQERLQLVNGDTIPGELLALDEERIEFRTPFAGDLRVPRKCAQSLHFGVTPQKLLYRGVRDLAGWEKNENWKLEGGNLICSTNGSIARPDVLTRNFILRFRLRWEQNPNLRFYFCDDLMERRGDADRYYFEINTGGLQLKRQTKDGDRRWIPIATLERRPEEFPDSTVDVEIRVDRKNRLLYFYLNGEKEGRYLDPIDDFPAGSGLMLYSLAGGDMKNIIELLEVYDWDAVSQLRRSEGHSDVNTDAIISTTGERFSGVAERLVRDGDGPRILFNSPHSDEVFRIPQRRISTLYFRAVEGTSGGGPATFASDWEGGGKLQLAAINLDPGGIAAKHPLLGSLSLDRTALRRLVASNTPAETDDPSEAPTEDTSP